MGASHRDAAVGSIMHPSKKGSALKYDGRWHTLPTHFHTAMLRFSHPLNGRFIHANVLWRKKEKWWVATLVRFFYPLLVTGHWWLLQIGSTVFSPFKTMKMYRSSVGSGAPRRIDFLLPNCWIHLSKRMIAIDNGAINLALLVFSRAQEERRMNIRELQNVLQ